MSDLQGIMTTVKRPDGSTYEVSGHWSSEEAIYQIGPDDVFLVNLKPISKEDEEREDW